MAGKKPQGKDKDKPKPSSTTISPRKARRASSWSRGQARKAERRRVQDEAWARNRETRARGGLTPWMTAKAIARERKGRSAEGGASNTSSNGTAAPAVEMEGLPVIQSGGGKREAIRKAKRGER